MPDDVVDAGIEDDDGAPAATAQINLDDALADRAAACGGDQFGREPGVERRQPGRGRRHCRRHCRCATDRVGEECPGGQVGAEPVESGPQPAAGSHPAADAAPYREKPLPAPTGKFDAVAFTQQLRDLPGAQQHDAVPRKGLGLLAGGSYRYVGDLFQCVLMQVDIAFVIDLEGLDCFERGVSEVDDEVAGLFVGRKAG